MPRAEAYQEISSDGWARPRRLIDFNFFGWNFSLLGWKLDSIGLEKLADSYHRRGNRGQFGSFGAEARDPRGEVVAILGRAGRAGHRAGRTRSATSAMRAEALDVPLEAVIDRRSERAQFVNRRGRWRRSFARERGGGQTIGLSANTLRNHH